MKTKNNNNNKGKIHPSPSSSSHSTQNNSLSILSLLPSTILTLITLLSIQEKQTLAYMLTRSINLNQNSTKRTRTLPHKNPLFDCDCFECYTSYWQQWDTSPNREIIHQAIEAFEEREVKQKRRGNNKRRDKVKKPIIEKVEKVDDVAQHNEVAVGGGGDDVAVPVRKVLPDVVGMIGSRLWSFWSPGIISNNNID